MNVNPDLNFIQEFPGERFKIRNPISKYNKKRNDNNFDHMLNNFSIKENFNSIIESPKKDIKEMGYCWVNSDYIDYRGQYGQELVEKFKQLCNLFEKNNFSKDKKDGVIINIVNNLNVNLILENNNSATLNQETTEDVSHNVNCTHDTNQNEIAESNEKMSIKFLLNS